MYSDYSGRGLDILQRISATSKTVRHYSGMAKKPFCVINLRDFSLRHRLQRLT
jgi:hypothetical protein